MSTNDSLFRVVAPDGTRRDVPAAEVVGWHRDLIEGPPSKGYRTYLRGKCWLEQRDGQRFEVAPECDLGREI